MPQSTFASVSPNKRDGRFQGWLVGWLGFNGILSTQVAAISSSEVCAMGGKGDGERAPITLSSLGPEKL